MKEIKFFKYEELPACHRLCSSCAYYGAEDCGIVNCDGGVFRKVEDARTEDKSINIIKSLIEYCEKANRIMLHEAGVDIVDKRAIE